jgi:hypothetical protein
LNWFSVVNPKGILKMAKWVHSDVLDNGLNAIKTNANRMVLLKAYTAGDSYATVYTTNNIAEATMASGDYTLAGAANGPRTLTVASGKTATAGNGGSGASPDLHIAFVDTATSKVLWVTDETSNQVVTAGNTVNFPSGLVYTSNQPT